MKKLYLSFLVLSILLVSAQTPKSFEEAKFHLQKGVETWNSEDLEMARSLFLNLCLTEKKENPYFYYYLSLADYRLSNYYLVRKEKEKAGRFIEEGLSFLEKAIKREPAFYESYALYASLLGLKINLKPEEAMFLGMESERYFSIALEKGGDNPRVNLLKGISTLYTPEMFGGGVKNALKFIEKAVSLFEKEKIDNPLIPSWGKEEAYTYLGIVYEKLGDRERAVQALKKALETNPNFGYAKINLERIEKGGK